MKTRFEYAVSLQKYKNKTVLDLGCRDKILKKYLKKDVKYQGVDFKMDEEVVSYNLEEGIPFEDNSFDVVFALDVLEHLENIHQLIDEIKRVAKNEAIIALPNCYHWHYKLNILRNKPLNTKYKVPANKILDRHRWLTYHTSSLDLVTNMNRELKVRNFKFICNYSKYKFLYLIDKYFSKYFPNTFTYTDFFQIEYLNESNTI